MVTNVSLDNYKSPIELTETPWRTIVEEKDDKIFVSIQSEYGVRLDKDELFKALHYDRAQYQKGYADGVRDAREEIVHCCDCDLCVSLQSAADSEVLHFCRHWSNRITDPTDYCSKGIFKKEVSEWQTKKL